MQLLYKTIRRFNEFFIVASFHRNERKIYFMMQFHRTMFSLVDVMNALCASSISIRIVKESASARHATDPNLGGWKAADETFSL